MSEGTPGRGPDADSRTDTGDGQAPTNGRPAVPPVRYGPRNGSPANGRPSNGRTVPGSSTPQQYRGPQPPRTPSSDAPANSNPANGSGTNGSGTNGSGTNGSGTNGSGSNGAHPTTPSSYTRPRPDGTGARPEPSEQDRSVANARIAAAARNASAAKVRGGSALSGNRSPVTPAEAKVAAPGADKGASVDETAMFPAVRPEDRTAPVSRSTVPPAEPITSDAAAPATTTTTTPTDAQAADDTATPEKGRGVLGRLRGRDRRGAKDPEVPVTAEAGTPVVQDAGTEAKTEVATEGEPAQTPSDAEPLVATTEEPETATEERPLTWRDRLGLAPKAPKPAEAETDAAVPTVLPAAAAAGVVGAGATEVAPQQDRITPTPLAPATTTDTVIIPAVDAGAVSFAPPVAAAPVVQPVAAPKAKVGAARRTRKARLRLSRVDPWSVMKTALLFSIAAGIILVVATYGVWSVLNASGLFDAVNDMVKSVVSTPGDTTPFRIEEYVNTQKIIGVAALIAVVDVLIFTALATLGSFLYNLAATVLGGLEVTLAED
ncbi:MAG TPA: DUF3566 domain-containing protein [Friedmanniella sp.]